MDFLEDTGESAQNALDEHIATVRKLARKIYERSRLKKLLKK